MAFPAFPVSSGTLVPLLPTGSEEREVLGVGSIPVAILPSCQFMQIYYIIIAQKCIQLGSKNKKHLRARIHPLHGHYSDRSPMGFGQYNLIMSLGSIVAHILPPRAVSYNNINGYNGNTHPLWSLAVESPTRLYPSLDQEV